MILSPSDLVRCVYLCLNKLAPAYEGIELGIGENILMKAIATATGRSVDKIKVDAQEKGEEAFDAWSESLLDPCGKSGPLRVSQAFL